MKRLAVIFLYIYILSAQSSVSKAGAFTRMSQNARSAALGNSGIALEANGSSFYYNPSAVVFSKKKSILGANLQYLSLDRRLYSVGYHKPSKDKIQLSLGWIHATVAELYEYSSEAIRGDKLNFGMNAFYASFGLKFSQNFAASFTSKYLHESLNGYYENDYKATGLSFDISTYFKLSNTTQFGIVLRDLGGALTTNSDKVFESTRETAIELNEKMPTYSVFGVKSSKLFQYFGLGNFFQIIDLRLFEDKTTTVHIGFEYNGFENGALRLGYDQNHINAGLGMDINMFGHHVNLDYAYISSFYDEGGSHIFSWSMDISK